MPQTIAKRNSTGAGNRNITPASAQQLPLTTIAHAAIRALPTRSANQPATADPAAPLAIAANATTDPAAAGLAGSTARNAAAANTAIHVHIAYSSHMCPR